MAFLTSERLLVASDCQLIAVDLLSGEWHVFVEHERRHVIWTVCVDEAFRSPAAPVLRLLRLCAAAGGAAAAGHSPIRLQNGPLD
jgi:hypothetical protein